MPRVLPEQEFNALRDRVLQSAPDGLDEAGFSRYIGPAMEQALGEAENSAAPSGFGDVVKGFAHTVNPIEGLKTIAGAIAHPKQAYDGMVEASANQFTKAYGNWKQGRYSEAIGHGLAGALPVIGPAAADAGEKLGQGDLTGLGEGLGQLALTGAARRLPGPAGTAAKAVQDILPRTAEHLVSSIVKPTKTLSKYNPTINIPRTILDEGFASGNLEKGAGKAAKLVEKLSADVSDKVNAFDANGQKLNFRKVLDELDRLETEYMHQPAAQADVAAVRSARQQLMENPLYATPEVPPGTMQVPHPTAVDAAGNPVMQSVPTPGRPAQLIPQTAAEIDRMKKNVYGGLKGKYGVEKGAVIETDKALGRGLKRTLDENVPGVEAINKRQSGVIASRNALQDAVLREKNKYPFGLMDLVAFSHGKNPLLAALLLKHPTTGLPIARGIDAVGHIPGVAGTAKAATVGAVAGSALQAGKRPVSKDEIARVRALLAQE